jgi:very-short-patch-repair endonuclease
MTRPKPSGRLTDLARSLRQDQTTPERTLWRRLRAGRLGAKFRRQGPIAGCIVDFLCLESRLAVEIDGDTHAGEEAEAEDRLRSRRLEERGLRVVRFTNREVMESIEGVLEAIRELISTPSPPPSPDGRGGQQLPPP